MKASYDQKSAGYMHTLCEEIQERSVGSAGNREATAFFRETLSNFGWACESSLLNVIDWEDRGSTLQVDNHSFAVSASPYSLGCQVRSELKNVSSVAELKRAELAGHIVLLSGEIAREQLMPKNFVFYNPDRDQEIISLLERKKPAAILTATGRNHELAGGVYPFPMFEDGDFDIPSVYMTEEEGKKLLPLSGKTAALTSRARRIPSSAYNVTALKGKNPSGRIVLSAHIDAKKGTPGALDNAAGVTVLLLIAEMLEDYQGDKILEMVAFNGEDYYAASGQMDYLQRNQNTFHDILLNINIDGAGYREGSTLFSLFDVPEETRRKIYELFAAYPGIEEGIQYPQGDHSLFVQQGIPAVAVSSKWLIDHINSQTITHTTRDLPEIVDSSRLVSIAEALAGLVSS